MLERLIDDAQHHGKRIILYTDDAETALDTRFSGSSVTTEQRRLPPHGPDPFVTIHDAGQVVGSLSLDDFEELLTPPIVRPGDREEVSAGYRALFDLFDDTVFDSLDRRQLLGASREIEDRAFRVGHGTLRASFQSLSVFESQVEAYRHLAGDTALDVHVYGEADWEPPEIAGVTYHRSDAATVKRFWTLAFDGGGDETQSCGLVAREQGNGYTGFWTYDPEIVSRIADELESVEA
ncbi:DICT sensory domain-containing protein [Salinibaculum salinum]|uniref:DICT sensory domain-containing protein n=1 Tax=Salinibaculum salinum TaxID=3131996 RepID=UPI0030ED3063